jgi:prophage tail gpP-like protein
MSDVEFPKPECKVTVNGVDYTGWTEVEIEASMTEAARTFRLQVSEEGTEAGFMSWQIRPDDEATIDLDGQRAVTGYIDARQAAYSGDTHTIQISGRSKTADIIDSSVDEEGGQFNDYKLEAIAQRLAKKHKVKTKTGKEETKEPFKDVQVQPGETVHELVERLARLRGKTVTDDKDGNLVIDEADLDKEAECHLIEGVNILEAAATLRSDKKFKKVKVKGQRQGSDEEDDEDVSEVEAETEDEDATRERTLVLLAEEPITKEDAKTRTDQEVARRAAEGIEAEVTVWGWHMFPGKLWEPGAMVHLTSPMLLVDRKMIVKSLSWKQSDSAGTITVLKLTPPEALTTKSKKGKGDKASKENAELSTDGDDYWKEPGSKSAEKSSAGAGAKKKATTPAKGGKGGQTFSPDDYWSNPKPKAAK